jgi:hypothetical protein
VKNKLWLIFSLAALLSLYFLTRSQMESAKAIIEEAKTLVVQVKKSEPQPVPTAPFVAEDKIKSFSERTSQMLRSLPQKRIFKQRNAHQTPPEVLQAAAQIAAVTDAWQADSELREPAFQFYYHCAAQAEGLPGIRAVCLQRARQLSIDLNKDLELDVPKEVLDLVQE